MANRISVAILELMRALRRNLFGASRILGTEPWRFAFNWADSHYRGEAHDLYRRCIGSVSDLSAFDGRVLAYRGIDG